MSNPTLFMRALFDFRPETHQCSRPPPHTCTHFLLAEFREAALLINEKATAKARTNMIFNLCIGFRYCQRAFHTGTGNSLDIIRIIRFHCTRIKQNSQVEQ